MKIQDSKNDRDALYQIQLELFFIAKEDDKIKEIRKQIKEYINTSKDFANVIPRSEPNNDKPKDMKLWKEYLEWKKSQK